MTSPRATNAINPPAKPATPHQYDAAQPAARKRVRRVAATRDKARSVSAFSRSIRRRIRRPREAIAPPAWRRPWVPSVTVSLYRQMTFEDFFGPGDDGPE